MIHGAGQTLLVLLAVLSAGLLSGGNALAQSADFALTVAPAEVTEGGSGTLTVEIINGVIFTTDQTITLAFTGTAAADDFTVYNTNEQALESPYSLTLETGERVAVAYITTTNDAEAEPAETITVTANHGTTAIGTQTMTIEASPLRLELESLAVTGGGRAMYPAFDAGTLHYAVGCAEDTPVTLMLSTKDTSIRLAVNGIQQSNQDATVVITGLDGDSDVLITLSNSSGASTTYTVHCVPTDAPVITTTARPGATDDLILFSTGERSVEASYLLIIDNNGVPRLRRKISDRASHFRTHPNGRYPYSYAGPWGTVPNFRGGVSNSAQFVMLDEYFEPVRTVRNVSPVTQATGHDFLIKEDGGYALLSYNPVQRDLSAFSNENDIAYSTTEGTEDSIIQEVGANGQESFRWNSWDHMAIEDCTQHRFPRDYAHINTIEDADGDYIASLRGCSQVVRIDGETGDVIWRLGRSNRSDEDWVAGGGTPPIPILDDPHGEFCGQHSATLLENGNLIMFDNGGHCVVDPATGESAREGGVFSRVVEYSLDTDLDSGQLVSATFQRHHSLHSTFNRYARSQGHVEPMPNGHWLISWGRGTFDDDPNTPLPPDEAITQVNPLTGEEVLSIVVKEPEGDLIFPVRAYLLSPVALSPPPPRPPGGGGGGSTGGGGAGGGGGGPRTSAPGAIRNLTAVAGNGEVVLTWDAPRSDGGAAITDYEYRIDGRNPWISIGSTLTTHTVTGLVNGTEYTFQLRAVNRVGKSFAPSQAEATPEAPELLTLDFAHFVNGTSITSDLVFVNAGSAPVRPVIYFYDTQGTPIAAASVVDVTGDLEVTEDGALTVRTEMEPLGVLTISTHGRGALVSGSVKVVAEGPIGGMLRYDLPAIGEAVVGAGPLISDALFPVRRREGGITTGVAIHNLEASSELVRCELLREGVLLDSVSLPLGPNGQTSWLIDAAFPATDTSDFVGSVRCDAVGEGRFSAVALEMDPGTRTFITLPVFPVEERTDQE